MEKYGTLKNPLSQKLIQTNKCVLIIKYSFIVVVMHILNYELSINKKMSHN